MTKSSANLWLVGVGLMGQDYAKILKKSKLDFLVVGKSESSAREFEKNCELDVIKGGVDFALSRFPVPESAILAVGILDLFNVASSLLKFGTKRLLIEKPGSKNLAELIQLENLAKENNAEVFIAYNRRFYSSVDLLKKLSDEDGGIKSCYFEFTEWSHLIEPLDHSRYIKEFWFFMNSTHVVDLVFHLCGKPKEFSSWANGQLSWHQSSARFVGSGLTEKDVLFSYLADWDAPGRWGIEFLTKKRRFILRPLEELQYIELGSLEIVKLPIEDSIDKEFKPGLYKEVHSFLNKEFHILCSLKEQIDNAKFYMKIANYDFGKK